LLPILKISRLIKTHLE